MYERVDGLSRVVQGGEAARISGLSFGLAAKNDVKHRIPSPSTIHILLLLVISHVLGSATIFGPLLVNHSRICPSSQSSCWDLVSVLRPAASEEHELDALVSFIIIIIIIKSKKKIILKASSPSQVYII